jgi:hypothetical protein
MKYLKLWLHEVTLVGILGAACILRMLLAANSWPLLNSDEGTIGIMALHIQHGARPIFFYGQNYMGALEAYLGALLFDIFGVSLFALRLGLLLLFAGFLVSMYLLTRLLYTKNLALYTVLLLSLGSNAVLSRQLSAIGGYMETIFCSALAFLLALWLALAVANPGTRGKRWRWRLVGYLAWGLVVGLGLWSDLLVLPAIFCSLLMILIFCWRDLLKGALIPLLGGLGLGALPLIIYNLGAAPGMDSWSNLRGQQGQVALSLLWKQIKNTLDVGIPIITGSPLCHFSELPELQLLGFEPSRRMTPVCHLLGRSWSLAFLFFLAISSVAVLGTLWLLWRRWRRQAWSAKNRLELVRYSARLLLIACALLTIIAYLRSVASLNGPAIFSRYMIGVWIALPAVLWPLWIGTVWIVGELSRKIVLWFARGSKVFCGGGLLLILCVSLFGTSVTLKEIPEARAADAQERQLIDGLLGKNITHIYTEYWTCNRIAFQSQERVICGVLNFEKCTLVSKVNRYQPYYDTVSKDANSAYVVPMQYSCDKAIEARLRQKNIEYRRFELANNIVYQPLKQKTMRMSLVPLHVPLARNPDERVHTVFSVSRPIVDTRLSRGQPLLRPGDERF